MRSKETRGRRRTPQYSDNLCYKIIQNHHPKQIAKVVEEGSLLRARFASETKLEVRKHFFIGKAAEQSDERKFIPNNFLFIFITYIFFNATKLNGLKASSTRKKKYRLKLGLCIERFVECLELQKLD